MNQAPRSWAASVVRFALAMLAACLVLNWAATLLREALPVLIPAAAIVLIGLVGRRWRRRRSEMW